MFSTLLLVWLAGSSQLLLMCLSSEGLRSRHHPRALASRSGHHVMSWLVGCVFCGHSHCLDCDDISSERCHQWSRSADQGGKANNAQERRQQGHRGGDRRTAEEARRGGHGSQQQQRRGGQDGARAAEEARQRGRSAGAPWWVMVIAGCCFD